MGMDFFGEGKIERKKEKGKRLSFWVVIELLRNSLHNVL
jgi:hypothetical protein